MDKQAYPVVAESFLDPVPPKRLLSRGPHGRSPDEIPRLQAGHRLVYFTGGEYVLDTTSLPLDSPTVVDASRVTVVDVTTDTGVVTLLTIPSQDAGSFTVRVKFLCTVVDPVAVVRAGGLDAESVVAGYLGAHHRLFELGLSYALSDINEIRPKVNAQIRAYVTVVPPDFNGMSAKLASVEMLTPEELKEFENSRRGQRWQHRVESEKEFQSQELEDQRQQFKHFQEADERKHARNLAAAQREYEREQLERTIAAVADDPVAALGLAYTAGDISAQELASELKEQRLREVTTDREDLRARLEFERERDKLTWESERLDKDRQLQWGREDSENERQDRLRHAEWDREDRRQEREHKHREIETRWEAERLDNTKQLQWDREDHEHRQKAELRHAEWDREDRRLQHEKESREFEAKLEVLRELAKHGHMDNVNLQLDKVMNDMLGGKATNQLEDTKDDERPALASLPDDEPQPDDLVDDEKVRVDD